MYELCELLNRARHLGHLANRGREPDSSEPGDGEWSGRVNRGSHLAIRTVR